MDLNMERSDYYVVGGGILLWLVLSYISYAMGWPIQVEQLFSGIASVFGLASVYFVYKYLTNIGGEIGKYFTLIAIGIIYYTLTLIPHVLNHIQENQILFAYFFQHFMVFWSFVLIAYGSYLFYKEGGK